MATADQPTADREMLLEALQASQEPQSRFRGSLDREITDFDTRPAATEGATDPLKQRLPHFSRRRMLECLKASVVDLNVVAARTELAKYLARDFNCDVASLRCGKIDFEMSKPGPEWRRDFFDIVASCYIYDVRRIDRQREA
jgi:hypothetical protein